MTVNPLPADVSGREAGSGVPSAQVPIGDPEEDEGFGGDDDEDDEDEDEDEEPWQAFRI